MYWFVFAGNAGNKELFKNIFTVGLSESANAAFLSVADARVNFFLRLVFADSSCANCRVIYEQVLSEEE